MSRLVVGPMEGTGVTCLPPPTGFVHKGFAAASFGVPGGIYPYYAAP